MPPHPLHHLASVEQVTGYEDAVLELLLAEFNFLERTVVLAESLVLRLPGCPAVVSQLMSGALNGVIEGAVEGGAGGHLLYRPMCDVHGLEGRLALASVLCGGGGGGSGLDSGHHPRRGHNQGVGRPVRSKGTRRGGADPGGPTRSPGWADGDEGDSGGQGRRGDSSDDGSDSGRDLPPSLEEADAAAALGLPPQDHTTTGPPHFGLDRPSVSSGPQPGRETVRVSGNDGSPPEASATAAVRGRYSSLMRRLFEPHWPTRAGLHEWVYHIIPFGSVGSYPAAPKPTDSRGLDNLGYGLSAGGDCHRETLHRHHGLVNRMYLQRGEGEMRLAFTLVSSDEIT